MLVLKRPITPPQTPLLSTVETLSRLFQTFPDPFDRPTLVIANITGTIARS